VIGQSGAVTYRGGVVRRFDNRTAQIAGIVFGSLIALIGLAGIAQPHAQDRIGGVVWILVGVGSAWRAAVTSNVVVRADRVDLRSMVRTRRIPLDQIARVEVAFGRTGMAHFGREYLVVHRRDGTATSFRDLSSKPSGDSQTIVQQAAREINATLLGLSSST
jgi:Bacterial PH domain